MLQGSIEYKKQQHNFPDFKEPHFPRCQRTTCSISLISRWFSWWFFKFKGLDPPPPPTPKTSSLCSIYTFVHAAGGFSSAEAYYDGRPLQENTIPKSMKINDILRNMPHLNMQKDTITGAEARMCKPLHHAQSHRRTISKLGENSKACNHVYSVLASDSRWFTSCASTWVIEAKLSQITKQIAESGPMLIFVRLYAA